MARIAGVNIPQNKVVKTALTYIHGIGDKTANDICTELKIDKNKRTNALTDDEVLKIREFIDSKYSVEGDLRRNVSLDIKRLKTYDEKTFPVLDYYLKKGIMKNIDGMQEINAISDQLLTLIRAIRG